MNITKHKLDDDGVINLQQQKISTIDENSIMDKEGLRKLELMDNPIEHIHMKKGVSYVFSRTKLPHYYYEARDFDNINRISRMDLFKKSFIPLKQYDLKIGRTICEDTLRTNIRNIILNRYVTVMDSRIKYYENVRCKLEWFQYISEQKIVIINHIIADDIVDDTNLRWVEVSEIFLSVLKEFTDWDIERIISSTSGEAMIVFANYTKQHQDKITLLVQQGIGKATFYVQKSRPQSTGFVALPFNSSTGIINP